MLVQQSQIWLGTNAYSFRDIVTGHTMNITQKIRIHHTVNPWYSTALIIVQITPENYAIWKFVNSVFQNEGSISR